MPLTSSCPVVPWHRTVLRAAAVYNIVWGTLAVLFPLALFRWAGVDPLPSHPELWQCVGMIVGVYGVGYWIAAADPVRHWAVLLVGLLGKILGPIGFLQSLLADRFPAKLGWMIVCNDLIWWLPFAVILLHARAQSRIVPMEPIVEEPIVLPIPGTTRRASRSAVVWSSLSSTSTDS